MSGRLVLVVALAILAAAQIVRTAFVRAFQDEQPRVAAALWPGHPDLVFRLEFDRIGRSTVAGGPAPSESVDRIIHTARRAPLAPEPFLARGVQAQQAELEGRAGRSFVEARRRDPRSVAARFFLADHYQRTNQLQRGLGEVTVLARLVPSVAPSLGPYFVSLAKAPGGPRQLRRLLASDPSVEAGVLGALAAEADNADLIMLLARNRAHPSASWPPLLIQELVEAGAYQKAHAVWTRLFGSGGGQPAELLFNPDFAASDAPPPFNWQLVSSPSGMAEVEGSGRLRIIYYGRDDMVLASQLLLLAPGRYQLSFGHLAGDPQSAQIEWRLTCLARDDVVLRLALDQGSVEAPRHAAFQIPSDCPAQRLELAATAPDFPATTNVVIGHLRVTKGRRE